MSLKRMIHLHFLMLMSRPSGPQASRATISMRWRCQWMPGHWLSRTTVDFTATRSSAHATQRLVMVSHLQPHNDNQ